MLNKICPKMIITLITIIVVTILIISGSIMLVTIHNAQNEFESSVKSAIDGGVPTAIQNILASKNRDMVKNGEIEALLETHADALGLS
ncbi:MAG: hypothetical protein RSC29_07740, partial [Oscillospiraceae bacterium]